MFGSCSTAGMSWPDRRHNARLRHGARSRHFLADADINAPSWGIPMTSRYRAGRRLTISLQAAWIFVGLLKGTKRSFKARILGNAATT